MLSLRIQSSDAVDRARIRARVLNAFILPMTALVSFTVILGCTTAEFEERKRIHATVGGAALMENGELYCLKFDGESAEVFRDKLVNLTQFPDVQGLIFDRTGIRDEDLRHVTGMQGLTFLDLFDTKITDAGLAHLNGLKRLEELDLTLSLIEGHGLIHLKESKALTQLDLYGAPITDEGMAGLKGVTNLERLTITSAKVTDAGLVHLAALTNLKQLCLNETSVTGEGLQHLSGLDSLRELGLYGSQVADSAIPHLAKLTKLERVTVTGTRMSSEGVAELKQLLPNCDVKNEDERKREEEGRHLESEAVRPKNSNKRIDP